MKKVIGVFSARRDAETAISQLRNEGFSKEISILGKDNQNQSGNRREQGTRTMENIEDLRGAIMAGGGVGSMLAMTEGEQRYIDRNIGGDGNAAIADESTDSITDGSATGGVIGGLAGLAAGAGALVIPGIGPMLAAGPIAGALTGAVTGGVAGGLIDWGIPAEESRRYEEHIKQGSVLVSVECSDEKVEKAMNNLRQAGASEVKQH